MWSAGERVGLKLESLSEPVPAIELTDGSMASSNCGPHIHGGRHSPLGTDRFVCVVADRCVVADALTKIVMAQGADSRNVLRQFGASAHFHDPLTGWQHLEEGSGD